MRRLVGVELFIGFAIIQGPGNTRFAGAIGGVRCFMVEFRQQVGRVREQYVQSLVQQYLANWTLGALATMGGEAGSDMAW